MTSFGAAAILWPLAAYGEQTATPVVGFLNGASAAAYQPRLTAFRQGLKKAGFVEGRNVALDYRWAEGHPDRLPALAAELVDRRVAVIASTGGVDATLAAKAATRTIPIVFAMGDDPVKLGVVDSLNRPGANMTGITFFTVELGAKRLQLLHELVPSAKVIAQVLHARTQETASSVRDVHAAADTLGLHVILLKAGSGDELDAAFVAASERHVDALIFGPDPNFIQYRDRAIALAARFAIPTIYPERVYVEKGGLLSYGQSLVGIYREVGVYVGHVLAGARPADMPVLRSTEFELVINRKTAAALRLDVPPSLLARADEVIE